MMKTLGWQGLQLQYAARAGCWCVLSCVNHHTEQRVEIVQAWRLVQITPTASQTSTRLPCMDNYCQKRGTTARWRSDEACQCTRHDWQPSVFYHRRQRPRESRVPRLKGQGLSRTLPTGSWWNTTKTLTPSESSYSYTYEKPNSRAGTVWPTSFTSLGPCRCLRRSTAVAGGVSSLTAADTAAMRSELNFSTEVATFGVKFVGGCLAASRHSTRSCNHLGRSML